MPYKHYKAEVIEKVIFEAEEEEVLSACPADDATTRRWINQFKERGSQAVGWLLSALFIFYSRHISAVELHNKSLLKQLTVLLREYRIPENGISREPADRRFSGATKELCESLRVSSSIIGRANIILTMYNYGFL
jgi:hypothetical protein